MSLRLSKRAETMQASPLRKLLPLAERAKKEGVEVLHLNIGQPDIPSPKPFLDALHNLTETVIEYSKSQGQDAYITALCEYYQRCGFSVEPHQVLVTQGGSEAIIFVMLATSDPGDEYLVFEPFYTNYNGFATIAGVRLSPLLTKAEEGFHLPSEEEIEARITSWTRGIIICNPNNPTGTVLRRDELEMLARVAKKHGVYLIADEVYREFVYDGEKHISLMSLPGMDKHAIVVDSVSKRYSLCGARIGAVITRNPDVYGLMVKYAQARLSAATIEQIACTGLVSLGQDYFDEIIAEYQARRDIVMDGLSAIPGCLCRKPKGAFYIIADLPVDDAEELTKFLLTDFRVDGQAVMIAPASGFYATPGRGKNQIRIAYILEQDKLRTAMRILRLGVEAYLKR